MKREKFKIEIYETLRGDGSSTLRARIYYGNYWLFRTSYFIQSIYWKKYNYYLRKYASGEHVFTGMTKEEVLEIANMCIDKHLAEQKANKVVSIKKIYP